jgi:hypothetical protein
MRTRYQRTMACVAALICLTSAGCMVPPPPKPIAPQPRVALPYARVAVVEFADHSPYPGMAEQFTQALREKLVERTDCTDVIVVPREAVVGDDDPFESGRLAVEALTRVRRDYLADAVIIGCLDGIDFNRPPSLQVSLKMVETARGTVAYEVSDVWNAAESRVRRDIQDYYQRHIGQDDCRFGPDMFLDSPRYYMRFVADQIVWGMRPRSAGAQ